jgi:hypothetical protein
MTSDRALPGKGTAPESCGQGPGSPGKTERTANRDKLFALIKLTGGADGVAAIEAAVNQCTATVNNPAVPGLEAAGLRTVAAEPDSPPSKAAVSGEAGLDALIEAVRSGTALASPNVSIDA